ncbi:MAG: MFS transporter [Aeoliella sp.]
MSTPQPPPSPHSAGANDSVACDDPSANLSPQTQGATPNSSRRVSYLLIARLSAMMFLQFASIGFWVVTVSTYIGVNTGSAGNGMFDSSFVGIAGISGALGALFAPLLFGALADSWFRSEHLMAALNVSCAIMLVLMWNASAQWWFFAWMVAYSQCCAPAVSLCTSLALRHLEKSKAAFAVARSIGTSGWVVALFVVGSVAPWLLGVSSKEIESSTRPMMYAMVAHLLMAMFSLTLPRTPPLSIGVTWRTLLGGSVALVRRQPRMMLFLLASFFATIAPQFYNMFGNLFLNNLNIRGAATMMSWGQVTEILCVLLLPWLLWRWGPKRIFVIGLLAWMVRYLCLTFGGPTGLPLAANYVAILLHGACFAFVYVTGYYYIDHASPPENRGTAQGLLMVVTIGFGHLVGSLFSGAMQARLLTPAGVMPPPYHWPQFFLIAACAALVALLFFWLLMGFHREVMPVQEGDDRTNEPPLGPLAK